MIQVEYFPLLASQIVREGYSNETMNLKGDDLLSEKIMEVEQVHVSLCDDETTQPSKTIKLNNHLLRYRKISEKE